MFEEISKDFIAGKKLITGFKVSKDRMILFLEANAAQESLSCYTTALFPMF